MKITIVLLTSFILFNAQADDAVKKTQEVLTDPAKRKQALKDPKANEADARVKALTGNDPQLTNEVYQLASEIFPDLAKQGKEDPKKMMEILNEAQRNPAAFANSLTPEQKEKLKRLGEKLTPTQQAH